MNWGYNKGKKTIREKGGRIHGCQCYYRESRRIDVTDDEAGGIEACSIERLDTEEVAQDDRRQAQGNGNTSAIDHNSEVWFVGDRDPLGGRTGRTTW